MDNKVYVTINAEPTFGEELKKIAGVCESSAEFTKRAKQYLREYKGIKQDIMSDAELRDIYREVARKREEDKAWDKFCNVIRPMLHKRPECKGLWYEVWIDLTDSWIDKWFSTFRFMKDEEIVEVCVKFLNKQERFYDSVDYTDMLDRLVAEKD